MRIQLVTRNFPPVVGGMERMLYNVYQELIKKHDVAIVGPVGCERFSAGAKSVVSVPLSPLARYLISTQWHAYRLARRFRPDIIISGNGLTAPAALIAASATDAKVACFIYGLDLVVESMLYKKLFLPAIRRCDRLISISRHTTQLATAVGAEANRIVLLNPGVSLPKATNAVHVERFRNIIGSYGRKVLLSVGRLSPRKGLCELIERALPQIVRQHPDVLLVIVGEEPSKALKHTAGQRSRIERAIDSTGLTNHVKLLGQVDDELLDGAYAAADLLVFPVLDLPGDVEGFGMVALEAAAHGLPTIAFAVGGVADAISDRVTGYLIKMGEYGEFADTVLHHLKNASSSEWRNRCVEYASKHTWAQYGERLTTILNDIVVKPH